MSEMLDLSTEEMSRRFAEAPVYRKSAIVSIREAIPGERIVTVMADGHRETENTAAEGEFVVTNPGGEQYVIDEKVFTGRYEPLGDGLYQAKGLIRAFRNPTGRPVTILAPWGEQEHQGPYCMFAALVTPDAPEKITGDRYLIGAREFADTYVLDADVTREVAARRNEGGGAQ
jgi:hypothetical protein